MTRNVFLFPGQGSQEVGMGQALAAASPAAAALFEEADAILGWSIRKFCWEGPEEELRRTDRTQPALYVTSAASLAILTERGIAGSIAAGHSVGEYAALYAAGAFDFATGLRLVEVRSRAMHEASQRYPGGMAALLGMETAVAEECCETVRHEHKGHVSVANLNSPGQVVISGESRALDLAIRLARMKGAVKVIPLAVAGAWHCSLMKEAETQLAEAIEKAEIRDPAFPVIANVTAAPVASAAEIRELLVRQVCGSVRWAESIQAIEATGADRYIEVGHGAVLSGLMKRLAKKAVAVKAATPDEINSIVTSGQ
jgi:[acyl-carrier-protein] S-malonyltransferase